MRGPATLDGDTQAEPGNGTAGCLSRKPSPALPPEYPRPASGSVNEDARKINLWDGRSRGRAVSGRAISGYETEWELYTEAFRATSMVE